MKFFVDGVIDGVQDLPLNRRLGSGKTLTAPRILVLLACRNGGPWLKEQLESILAQRGVDVHIQVEDDASVDESVLVVRGLQARDPRIDLRVWSKASGSAGASFRRIFREIGAFNADFVALSDQDDLWDPDKLRTAVRVLDASQSVAYSCAVRAFWTGGRERLIQQNGRTRGADFLFEGAGQGCTFVLRQEFFQKVQNYCLSCPREADALHYHDWLIYLLARTWEEEWYFDPTPWVRYRQHGGNEIGSRGGIATIRFRIARIRDGWYARQISAALSAVAAVERGGGNPLVETFRGIFFSRRSFSRRLRLAAFFLAHGRRRLIDRGVMGAAALIGWI